MNKSQTKSQLHEKMRQGDFKFKASLGNSARLSQNKMCEKRSGNIVQRENGSPQFVSLMHAYTHSCTHRKTSSLKMF